MKLGFSYLRFSNTEQGDGDTVRRQKTLRDVWCERNKVTLDTSVTLEDRGVSAFTGLHRSNPDRYRLAAFLEMVQEGKIPRDSFFIIENLDRLSREHERAAVRLWMDILDAGVNIVTVEPEYVFKHDSNDQMFDIMRAVMEFGRGHGESARKSFRVGAAWQNKKDHAATRPVTAMCPFWLRLDGDLKADKRTFSKIPDRTKVIQDIFQMCIDGLGVGAICRTLNLKKVPTFRGRHWQKSSVARILSNRAVLGEYQPCVGSKKRTPVGDPIKKYYPWVITSTDFDKAQQALAGRRKTGGRERTRCTNLFTSLVFDAADNTRWNAENKGAKNNKQGGIILSNTEGQLRGAERKSFPYDLFEGAVLSNLKEITSADLATGKQKIEASRLTEISIKIGEKTQRAAELKEKLVSHPDITGIVESLGQVEKQKKELVAEYEEVRRTLATPTADGAEQVRGLVELLAASDDKQKVRQKLRAKIAAVVEKITITYSTKGKRLARQVVVGISFRNVSYTRVVVFDYAPRGTIGVKLKGGQKPRVRAYSNEPGPSKTSKKPSGKPPFASPTTNR